MQPHQRRILGRIADEIDDYRAGRQSMLQLLNDAWSLFDAAEIRDPDDRARFMRLYYAWTSADDAMNPAMPEVGSEDDVLEAMAALGVWVRELRDGEQHEG